MKRIETIRLYPTAGQLAALTHALHVTRHLYNAALQERRGAYRLRRVSISAKMQYAELTALRKESVHLRGVYRELEDAVLHRLDLAMAAFFRRCKRGETPGFPRFRTAARWRQLEFPHGNRALKFDPSLRRIRIAGVGSVKLRKGRTVPPFGRAWLVRKRGRGDTNRRKAIAAVARLHEKVARQRRDYAHKVSRTLVNAYDGLALEKLAVKGMTKSAKGTPQAPGRNVAAKTGLNRALLDAGFGQIAQLIAEKAESAARDVVYVDPKNSSQECAACGHTASENRSGARFACVGCGYAASDSQAGALGPPLRGLWYETTAVPETREQAARIARSLVAAFSERSLEAAS